MIKNMPIMEEVSTGRSSTINDIFLSQQQTSKRWRKEPLKSRVNRLKKIQKWVESHREVIQEALYQDFKKPAPEVDLSEIFVVLSEIKHALKHLHHWVQPKKVDAPLALLGTKSSILYEPKGVCLIISPWNFPFNLSIGPLVLALAAGNTAILKPSELTPHCTRLIEQMVADLFEPSEVTVFSGGKEVAQELLQLPFDHIFFTGSPAVGKLVMKSAAQNLTSVTLELGGKSPTIIDETASLRDAAEKIAWGKFINTGQTCIAPDYLLVHHSVKEDLIEELHRAIDHLFNDEGLGIENSPYYARIINSTHFERLHTLLTQALDLGASLEIGGVVDPGDNYIAPTVISDIPSGSAILEEEIFGPILPIISYDQISEALEIINDYPKPLALYIFSKSNKQRKRIMEETSSGSVAINDCVIQYMNPNLPFGGVSSSGFGKSHGHSGFLAFSNEKSVLKQKIGLTSVKPVFPPYDGLTKKAIDLLLKYF